MEEKKPLETKIPKNTEVERSIEIQIQKQKRFYIQFDIEMWLPRQCFHW